MTTYSQREISRWAYDGENEIRFVLAEDAKMLQQHNEEMLEVLRGCLLEINFSYKRGSALWLHEDEPVMQSRNHLITKIQNILSAMQGEVQVEEA